MSLIAYYEVKMSAGKQFLIVNLYGVNAVHHCLIGRENAVSIIIIFLFTKVCHWEWRVVIYKCSFCLSYERCSVRKEKDIFNPSRIKKHMAQLYYGSRLTGTCRHDKKCFTAVILIKTIAYRLYCGLLIITTGNLLIYIYMIKGCLHLSEIKHLLKVCLGIYAGNLPLGILSVYNSRFKTIG